MGGGPEGRAGLATDGVGGGSDLWVVTTAGQAVVLHDSQRRRLCPSVLLLQVAVKPSVAGITSSRPWFCLLCLLRSLGCCRVHRPGWVRGLVAGRGHLVTVPIGRSGSEPYQWTQPRRVQSTQDELCRSVCHSEGFRVVYLSR